MKTSANGRLFIELWEENGKPALKPYDDGTGTLTIGFGHTTAAGPPRVTRDLRISPEQADAILGSDLAGVEIDVNRFVKVPLTQDQFDTLVSFHFNTGGLGRSSLLRDINAGHMERVQRDLDMWVKGGGRVMQGLVRRRKAEGVLFREGRIVKP